MIEIGRNFEEHAQKSQCADPTRRAIMAAALEEFALRSVEGARTREIAKKANVNHAAINYHFGGKSEMYMKIIRAIIEKLSQYYAPVYKEIDTFLASGSEDPSLALVYIKRFLSLSNAAFDDKNLSYFQILIRREEAFPTEAFEIVFKGGFVPIFEKLSSLCDIAAKKSIPAEKIAFTVIAILTMNHALFSCKTAFLRINKEAEVSSKHIDMFNETISDMLDKIFK